MTRHVGETPTVVAIPWHAWPWCHKRATKGGLRTTKPRQGPLKKNKTSLQGLTPCQGLNYTLGCSITRPWTNAPGNIDACRVQPQIYEMASKTLPGFKLAGIVWPLHEAWHACHPAKLKWHECTDLNVKGIQQVAKYCGSSPSNIYEQEDAASKCISQIWDHLKIIKFKLIPITYFLLAQNYVFMQS